jgi:hypothetical protein
MSPRRPSRFTVGDHVLTDAGLCGTVASAFEAYGGSYAYGVMYDDHTPESERPFGSPGHSYAERDLTLVV